MAGLVNYIRATASLMKQDSMLLAFGILAVTIEFVILTFGQSSTYSLVCELLVFTLLIASFLVMLYLFQQDRERLNVLAGLLPRGESLVLKELIQHHKLSRTDLQVRTNLAKKELSAVLGKLISKKVLFEKEGQVYLVMDI